MNWLATLLFAGGSQAFLLAVLLLCMRTGCRLANGFLASFLFLMAFTLLLNFLAYAEIALYPPLYGLHILQVLSGPALYLYVRALTEPRFTLSPQLGWHGLILLPVLVYFLVVLTRTDLGSVITGTEALKEGRLPIQLISAICSILYGVLSLRKLSQHRALIEQAFSRIEEVSLVWLRWIILLFIGFKLIRVILVLLSELDLLAFELRTWMSLLPSLAVVYLISIGGMRQPLIFTQSIRDIMEQLKAPPPAAVTPAPTAVSPPTEARSIPDPTGSSNAPGKTAASRQPAVNKYKKSGLDSQRMAAIWAQLQALMEEQQPHLTNALNLPELAEMLAVKPKDLSQVINAHAEANFYEFINRHRVSAAKQLLADTGKNGKLTMLDTAMAVGFNSQSTFYSHFKKHTGQTPKQFRDRQER